MALKKAVQQSKSETSHLFAKNPGEDSVVKRIKNWSEKIKKLQVGVTDCPCNFRGGGASGKAGLTHTMRFALVVDVFAFGPIVCVRGSLFFAAVPKCACAWARYTYYLYG